MEILINNHFTLSQMNDIDNLNTKLLKQPFTQEPQWQKLLDNYLHIASNYAQIENAIAVLSDMKANKSYIYYGGIAEKLNLEKLDTTQIIPSIWEEEVISHIHPDDLSEKYLEELRFYHFMKNIPEQERTNYYLANNIRMCSDSGEYVQVLHRMFYLAYDSNNCARLALCLYNLAPYFSTERLIINSATGQVFKGEEQDYSKILTEREQAVLLWIQTGKMSKEIAQLLSISIHTVNRHRQNILEKLQVSNSIEACQIAKKLGLL